MARRRVRRAATVHRPGMLTVGQIIERLFPNGTRSPGRHGTTDRSQCPGWPPDLFAVAATLVQKSGAYAYYSQRGGIRFGVESGVKLSGLGREWRERNTTPQPLQDLWKELLGHGNVGLEAAPAGRREAGEPPRWWEVAMQLLGIADEAAYGMGFGIGQKGLRDRYDSGEEVETESAFAALVVTDSRSLLKRQAPHLLAQLPSSLCWLVPMAECSVLPKTRTPQVGITLPRLSNNLALLPPVTEVRPRWLLNPVGAEPRRGEGQAFNLLLIPFPYFVDGTVVAPADVTPAGRKRFAVKQTWLQPLRRSTGARPTPPAFARFVRELVERAGAEVGTVHGVILPELALNPAFYEATRNALEKREGVQLFVSGVCVPPQASRETTNVVRAALFWSPVERPRTKLLFTEVEQAKHHRWKLEASQIKRYHLGHLLDPAHDWWEETDVSRRECTFFQISNGASVATLICEDLARNEPVQPLLRAVGPSLVIAILMDGPQLERRWPGRYATVLADDPGSAVLTLTCLGFTRRSVMPGQPEPRTIALWKEPRGQAEELSLPSGAHGLSLALRLAREQDETLDQRKDGWASVSVSLAGARGIAHPKPPAWLSM